jgi:hypothetical protein
MAVQTPLHLQRRVVVHQRHAVDRPMTGIAADALGDVNAVIEIDEIRQVVHARPYQRLPGAEAFPDGFQHRRFGPDLRMTIHARLGRRNAGKPRDFDRGVAVTAIDAQPCDMVLVTERNRLWTGYAGVGHVGRTLDLRHRPKNEAHDKNRAKNGRPRNAVSTAMKDLGHR